MWSPLRHWSPIRQWLRALSASVAIAHQALRQAASVESDRRAWTGGSFDVAVCIRPRRYEAARVFGERAA